MFGKVRKNFIAITMTMLTLVLIIPLCALNIITAALTYSNTNELLEQIAQTEVYILEPEDNKSPDDQPHENNPNNMGVVKQIHTTPTTTTTTVTTTTTTAPSEAITDTTKTTVRNNYQPPTVGTTAPNIQPPTVNTTTATPQLPPEWGDWTKPNEQTRPTRPTRPEYTDIPWEENNNKDEEYWDEDSYYYEYGMWYGDYSVDIAGARVISPAAIINALAQGMYISDSVSEISSAAVTTTTVTTTVMESEDKTTVPEKPPGEEEANRSLVTKSINKNMSFPKDHQLAVSNSIDHFVVYLDKSEQVTEVHGTDIYTVDACTEIINNIEKGEIYEGKYENLQYVRKDYQNGAVMVFSDRSSDVKMLKILLFVSIGMFLLMECIVFVLTKILTRRAMRPMQISIEKQQQFISDAGHELKTPLTVISANADILADEIGDNKWLGYIKSQAERMRILVQEMLDLTKITNSDQHIAQSRFNISSLVENVALPFECQAFEQKKEFHIELEPDVEFFGNTERIRRMIGIFIDNAFKYSNENGTIQVQLKTENGKKVLKIYNTGIGIAKGEEDKIFERFYRSDSSRSKQSGYGLGLAIAKSIADQHGIKIQVVSEPGQWVSFNLML